MFRIWVTSDRLDSGDTFSSTTDVRPAGVRFRISRSMRPKLASLSGGTPSRQRLSSASRSPAQSETLDGGLARMTSAFRFGYRSL